MARHWIPKCVRVKISTYYVAVFGQWYLRCRRLVHNPELGMQDLNPASLESALCSSPWVFMGKSWPQCSEVLLGVGCCNILYYYQGLENRTPYTIARYELLIKNFFFFLVLSYFLEKKYVTRYLYSGKQKKRHTF